MTVENVVLPDLGEGLTEATIVRWLVAVGDRVAEDQVVAEVETAKATVELPTPHAGTVAALHAGAGDEVDVGATVLSLEVGAADDDEQAAPSDDGGAASPTSASGAGDDAGGDLLVGYGADHTRSRRRRGRIRHGPTSAAAARPRAKPPVRKMAKDLGVDLDDVRGSGPGGRITRDDVKAAAAGASAAGPTAPAAAAHTAPAGRAVPDAARARTAAHGVADATGDDVVDGSGARREPVTGIRARIADHLSVAWREIPAASCWVQCDATGLLAARDELAAAHPDVRVTPLALILRSCAVALRQVPQLNASFDGQAREIVHHERVDLGVATQTDRGLVVPVVRDAAARSVVALAGEVRRLADAARAGSIAPGELVGSTFSVSNFGAFGVDGGGPIVNHPEAGILGVGRIVPRPWVVDGAVVARPVVELSLSFDHRVCDGAEAAGFLRLVADLIERPTRLLAY